MIHCRVRIDLYFNKDKFLEGSDDKGVYPLKWYDGATVAISSPVYVWSIQVMDVVMAYSTAMSMISKIETLNTGLIKKFSVEIQDVYRMGVDPY